MAFDERLAERIRAVLADRDAVREQRMFGGIAFMARGNMVVGISGGELMARVGAEGVDRYLGEPGVHPMRMGERTMAGLLRVSAGGIATDEQLRTWIRALPRLHGHPPAEGIAALDPATGALTRLAPLT